VRELCPTNPAFDAVNAVFERALVYMGKMPRIWIDYLTFLTRQHLLTKTRHTFDRALRALPLTQHKRIWPLYTQFIKSHDIPDTALRVYRRFVKMFPESIEEFIAFLISTGRFDEAARYLAENVVNNDKFTPSSGKTKHELWIELCELMAHNPDKITSLRPEPIIRSGIKRFSDMVGRLWITLADLYVRSGNFERARDIFEEAIQSVMTVRDFSLVFDAYSQFEETTIAALMQTIDNSPAQPATATTLPSDLLAALANDNDLELEMRLARLERLMDRRPLLLNSVLLRQNPHNVHEWIKRTAYYLERENVELVVATFNEAIATIKPTLAVGRLPDLWKAFASFYETHSDLQHARQVFERAVNADFKRVDDLAEIWCQYAELELRHKQPRAAIAILQRATTPAPRSASANYHDESSPAQLRVHRSIKLWALYADLEESMGTVESCKDVYTRILELRIATPQILLNFALFLEEHQYFEEAFRVYEKGVALFKWPVVADLWNMYLTKFAARYRGAKMERMRDLFEQALSDCPDELCYNIFLMYAKFEEEFGLARHAMAVYERACSKVPVKQRYELYRIYIARVAESFGIVRTRAIFERAIEQLADKEAKLMCLQFAELEAKLGEIDRARAIFAHGSQMADPRTDPDYWAKWSEFETRFGNEDTYRDLLRVRRSVLAVHNTRANFVSAQVMAGHSTQWQAASQPDSMSTLEAEQTEEQAQASPAAEVAALRRGMQFVRAAPSEFDEMGSGSSQKDNEPSDGSVSELANRPLLTRGRAAAPAANPSEISLDDDDNDDHGVDRHADTGAPGSTAHDTSSVSIGRKAVPSGVFGGLAATAAAAGRSGAQEPATAMDEDADDDDAGSEASAQSTKRGMGATGADSTQRAKGAKALFANKRR
jgi:pre-mRNA-splicing factor SYF1